LARPTLPWTVGMGTDPGRKRGYNQDSVGKQEPSDSAQLQSRGALYIVADGVGGGKAGEVASQMAVRATIQGYYGAPPTMDNVRSLRQAISRANDEVFRQSQANPEWQGMATTIVAVVAQLDGRLIVANAGDSRGYVVRNGRASVLTEDHTWVAEQVAAGILTPQQAKTHKRRHQITRSLGRRPTVDVVISTHQVLKNDIVVLCSDGITDVVEDQEIADAVRRGEPQPVVDELIALANSRGGPDNISVLIIKYPQVQAAGAPAPARKGFPKGVLVGGAVVAVLAIAAVVAGALSRQTPTSPSATAVAAVSTQLPTVEAAPTQEAPAVITEEATSPTETSAATEPTAAPTQSVQVAATEAEREATATLVPTPEATSTPLPTATPAKYSVAPTLTAPGHEEWMQSSTATLKWSFAWRLKPSEQYELRIWKQGQPGVFIKRLRTTSDSYDYKMPDYDKYEWTVVVLRQPSEGAWVEVSDPAAVRAFYWAKEEKPPEKEDDGKPEPTKPKEK